MRELDMNLYNFVLRKEHKQYRRTVDWQLAEEYIKMADFELHKKYTGVGNDTILQNYETLKASGKPYIIRTPLIPNITDTTENLEQINKIIGNSKWEKLPYNAAAAAKYKMLGLKYFM